MTEFIRGLDITALVHGGRGIGRHDGKAVFVPLTVPGDRIACRVVKSRRRYIEAELFELLEPSSLRRRPPCPFFGSCGGCQWQHLPYQQQARWKERIFTDLMLRSGVATSERLKPIFSAPDEWGYRNRVQLKCSVGADGLNIGFYRHGTHDVVDIDKCLLVSSPMQATLDHLRRELPGAPYLDSITQVDVGCGDAGEVRVVLHAHQHGRHQAASWLQGFAIRNQVRACMQTGNRGSLEVVHGDCDLTVRVDQPEITLRSGPGGFVQVNSAQNRNMVAAMLNLLELDGTENVLELFCGMGNFSLPLARRASRVVGIEDHAPSIASACINAAANHIKNVDFHAADAAIAMARHRECNLDLVVLDPPRSGSCQVVGELLKIRPERVLYVSCDPATLVRDLIPLCQSGYEVISSQPFDLFPQTWHIESMTLLRKMSESKSGRTAHD